MSVIPWSICSLLILALIYGQRQKVCGATLCSPPCLLVTNGTDVVALDYNTTAQRSVISGLRRAFAIDVHLSLGYIFWSDIKERNIKRFCIDTGNTTTIITGIGFCSGLAVDWRASQLYWTDEASDTISVSHLDGNNQVVLISSGLGKPSVIALDLDNSLMFWTAVGTNSTIKKASLNGSQIVSIVTTHLGEPNGIELDRGNKRIFWVDTRDGRVESVDYSGNNRTLLYQLSGLKPFGLTLISPFLFFTDLSADENVYQLDTTNGKVVRKYTVGGREAFGIVAYVAYRLPADNIPPSFNDTCPSNMVVYATECSSSALITWSEPVASNNSGHVFISYPAIRPPVKLSIGLYNVLYSALDSSGNQANCTFIVQVARKSCPVLQPPIHGFLTSFSCGPWFGSQASLACDKGYRMVGSHLRSCRADGTWSGNVTSCNKISSSSSTGKQGMSAKILYPVIALGSLLVIAFIGVAIFFLWKRRLGNTRAAYLDRSNSHGKEGNIGFNNQAYKQTNSIPSSDPECVEIGQLQPPSV